MHIVVYGILLRSSLKIRHIHSFRCQPHLNLLLLWVSLYLTVFSEQMPTTPWCLSHPRLAGSHSYRSSGALGGRLDSRRWKRGHWLWYHGPQTWKCPPLLVDLHLTDPAGSLPKVGKRWKNQTNYNYLLYKFHHHYYEYYIQLWPLL